MSETNNLPIDYPEPSEDRDFLDQLIHEQEMLKHVYDLNVELMSPPKSLVNLNEIHPYPDSPHFRFIPFCMVTSEHKI